MSATLEGYISKDYMLEHWRKFVDNKTCFRDGDLGDRMVGLIKNELWASDQVALLRNFTLGIMILLVTTSLFYLVLLFRKKKIQKMQVGTENLEVSPEDRREKLYHARVKTMASRQLYLNSRSGNDRKSNAFVHQPHAFNFAEKSWLPDLTASKFGPFSRQKDIASHLSKSSHVSHSHSKAQQDYFDNNFDNPMDNSTVALKYQGVD